MGEETQTYLLNLHDQNSRHFFFTDFFDPVFLKSSSGKLNLLYDILEWMNDP